MTDLDFMRLAMDEARAAATHDDVPVGAVLARGDEILARAGNEKELRGDPTAHAEMLCLRAAAELLGTWRLSGTTMYVTLEPCTMCAGALVGARVERLVYGPQDPVGGAAFTLYNIVQDPRLNHNLSITTGVLEQESSELLRSFFGARR
ncbi:MAG: nucleoside deaminase [Actinomycetota bacterium]